MAACFLATLFLRAIFTANGAAVVAEQSILMRRADEAPLKSKIEVGPRGELISVDEEMHKEDRSVVPEECNDVFPFGTDGTDDCLHNASLIPDDTICLEAATVMNRTLLGRGGMINPGDVEEQQRPRGCFKQACDVTQDPNGECFTFNNRDTPATDTIMGTPVCMRKRYMNGTHTPGAEIECPEGYEEISTEGVCRIAGGCRGECEGPEFRTIGENKHKYPFGCFIDHEVSRHGCVYFNNRTGTLPNETGGTPICRSKILPPYGVETAAGK